MITENNLFKDSLGNDFIIVDVEFDEKQYRNIEWKDYIILINKDSLKFTLYYRYLPNNIIFEGNQLEFKHFLDDMLHIIQDFEANIKRKLTK